MGKVDRKINVNLKRYKDFTIGRSHCSVAVFVKIKPHLLLFLLFTHKNCILTHEWIWMRMATLVLFSQKADWPIQVDCLLALFNKIFSMNPPPLWFCAAFYSSSKNWGGSLRTFSFPTWHGWQYTATASSSPSPLSTQYRSSRKSLSKKWTSSSFRPSSSFWTI